MSILNKYQRHPKHYVSLPSNGFYYEEGSIELTHNNELPVRAMTAKDELLLKNPEALLNGDSVAKVISSCCPEIKMDIMDLVAPDIEVILLAVLSASFSDELDFEATCPECGTVNEYKAIISDLLKKVKTLDPPFILEEKVFDIENNEEKIKFHLTPYTYKQETNRSIMEIENQKMFHYLSDGDIDEDEKLKRYADSFNKMIKLNFDTIADSITKIETNDGSEDNKELIEAFINDLDSETIKRISAEINEINESGIDKNFQAKCQNKECGHEWETSVEFDPAFFFAKAYSH